MPRTKKVAETSSKNPKHTAKQQDIDHLVLAFRWLKESSFGHFVLSLIVILAVVGVDIILTGNHLSSFLLLFGIEFLLVNIFIWLVVVLRRCVRAGREGRIKD